MGKQTVEILVEGGKATAGPPLGTSLGPMGINVKAIVDDINEKTKDMTGIKVPVKIIVDTATKKYDIHIGTPPVSALVKKELNLEKGSGEAGNMRVGDLNEEQVKKIAKTKFGSDSDVFVSQVKGTCRSMGVTIGQGELTEEEVKKAKEKPAEKPPEEKPAEGEEAAEEKPEEEPKKEEKPKEEKKRKERKGKS